MKKIYISSLAAFTILAPLACSAATVEGRVFTPPNCEFAAPFPTVPVVKNHFNRSTGDHAIQAQTPGSAFPWILAQCTTGRDGSPPPDVENRLDQVRGVLRERGAANIRTSTVHDTRGAWTKATGNIVIDGQPLTMAVASIAGASSMLVVSSFMRTAEDSLKFERFLAEVMRAPKAPSGKK